MYNNNLFDKNPSPKRRKAKDNPYTIFTVGPASDLHYYLFFVDNRGMSICMEISRQLFEAFDQFERDDLSYMNEIDNHYAVHQASDPCIQRYVAHCKDTIEEIVERYQDEKTPLMMILSDIQHEFGYIPLDVQELVSEKTGIAVAEIYGVVIDKQVV